MCSIAQFWLRTWNWKWAESMVVLDASNAAFSYANQRDQFLDHVQIMKRSFLFYLFILKHLSGQNRTRKEIMLKQIS